ncbi:OmpH family outer membrane protein [Akkermansia sp.]|uniref:OmpH family outer membrane protein n=1 Tax=Akkermansia sp. TaxID=1872421 RepID=UPI0025B9E427|nr:OmpH family outer membrane protein [Akkermansia sp.]MCC8148144.1 OmpH family outer membrane protein [Akkermansia sp.]
MAFSATANAELKVATVDVQKLFTDYYKTHEAQAEVDKAAQTVQETNNTRAETIKKMEADFNDMVKKLQDPMLNEKDKKDLEQKAQIKRQEVIALEQERRGFVERQLKSLQEQMKVRSTKIMGEITKITEGIATKGNYDLVLDKSAQALRSNQVFVYTKPSMDITPTVMKELNKDAPKDFDPTKKKAPAVPAAPAAPAN